MSVTNILYLSPTVWVWHRQSVSVTDCLSIKVSLCLSQTNFVFHRKSVICQRQTMSVEDSGCLSQKIFVCQRKIMYVTYRMCVTENLCLPQTVCVSQSQSQTVFFCLSLCLSQTAYVCHRSLLSLTENLCLSKKKYVCKQGWIFLRDLQDYLLDNLDKFRQSLPGNKVWSVKHILTCPDRLSTTVLRNNRELLKNN